MLHATSSCTPALHNSAGYVPWGGVLHHETKSCLIPARPELHCTGTVYLPQSPALVRENSSGKRPPYAIRTTLAYPKESNCTRICLATPKGSRHSTVE